MKEPTMKKDPACRGGSEVFFVHTGYGKEQVKVLQVKRNGKQHFIKEIEASVQLSLRSHKDYTDGDNSDIIPTDTIKNTVYALAKLKGIKTIEEFSLEICKHFLTSFDHVTEVKVHVREAPWKRMEKNGEQHVHAFIYSPEGVHTCDVEQKHGGDPVIYSGIEELRILKTTQSGFVGFLKDRFTTLPEVSDRCFSTVVSCRWKYNTVKVANFDTVWAMVKETILDLFAGPPKTGEYSPSVQKTLYDIQKLSLKKIPEIEEIELILPNKHNFAIDLSKLGLENHDEILLPSDIPYGIITGTVRRAIPSKL